MKKRTGFTLIELLIVVAIIAILAAIAVPNFLEAQTRAKVSRAKSDMRTIGVALEAYRTDETWYPFGNSSNNGVMRLTSPVNYLGSVPSDPFTDKKPAVSDPGNETVLYSYMPYYLYVCGKPGGYLPQDPTGSLVDAVRSNWGHNVLILPYTSSSESMPVLPDSVSCPAIWTLRSSGPDRDIDHAYPYDSTNGTKSNGDISLFGPGNCGRGF